jgi:ubiquinone/menaquinone biosynthesis C-methylase UbiE
VDVLYPKILAGIARLATEDVYTVMPGPRKKQAKRRKAAARSTKKQRQQPRSNISRWDIIAPSYQADHVISLEDVHYGPLCAGEKELQLLGDVENRKVLEIGCGGGQNSFVLTQWGAHVTALEPSRGQLNYARQLNEGVERGFNLIQGRAEDLSMFRKESFDLVLSSLSLDYVPDIEEVFRQVYRILLPGGSFVFSMIHPLMNFAGWYMMDDPDTHTFENYFEMRGLRHSGWDFQDGTQEEISSYQHTLEELFSALVDQGFSVSNILEPRPYDLELLGKENWGQIPYFYRDFDIRSLFYQVMQTLPYTLIFQSFKQSGGQG